MLSASAFSQTQPASATIDASKTGAPISKYIYGQFLEHPLDVSAALSNNRKTLTFGVLNPSDSEQQLKLTINGAKLANRGHLWRMAPTKVTAVNIVGQKPEVEVQEQGLTSVPDTMSLPPFSISIYSFPVQ